VANALGCNARGHGFAPSLGDISVIYFLELIQSMAQGDLKWSVGHCGTFCDLQCLRCLMANIYLVDKMVRYNKYQSKQLHAHTYTCTHNSWWIVLVWVTTKEFHPLPRLDRQLTSSYGAMKRAVSKNI